MNREELNWLLQTIEGPENTERFVLAQYERGRISFQMMADASERTTRRRGSYYQQAVDVVSATRGAKREGEGSAMPSKVLDESDKAGLGNLSRVDPAAEDAALVVAAKSGDSRAFEILVERHEQRVFFAARRITRTREDAEDVVQQSFQKAFTHLRKFEGRSAFSTWLTRIAITEALMFLRRNRGLREVLIEDLKPSDGATNGLEVPDSSPDPEAVYSQRERAEMLSLAIDELPYGTRKAIQLRELDERSSEETARIMGISVAALKGRMFHGRRKLRETLKRYIDSARTFQERTFEIKGNTNGISRHRLACHP
jgi:RNA polymerase sigma-70 factor (ECF subfamily)